MIAQVLPYLVAALFAFSAGWQINGWRLDSRIASFKQTQAEQAAKGIADVRATENGFRRDAEAAARAAQARSVALAAVGAAARAESDGLRDDLRAALAAASGDSCRPDADHPAAGAELLEVLEAGLERLAAEGARIAAAADGHANDTRTLMAAWPKSGPRSAPP